MSGSDVTHVLLVLPTEFNGFLLYENVKTQNRGGRYKPARCLNDVPDLNHDRTVSCATPTTMCKGSTMLLNTTDHVSFQLCNPIKTTLQCRSCTITLITLISRCSSRWVGHWCRTQKASKLWPVNTLNSTTVDHPISVMPPEWKCDHCPQTFNESSLWSFFPPQFTFHCQLHFAINYCCTDALCCMWFRFLNILTPREQTLLQTQIAIICGKLPDCRRVV